MTRSVVFGVDPALRSPGVAVLVDDVLVACDSVKVPADYADKPMGERIDAVAELCVDWFVDRRLDGPTTRWFKDVPVIVAYEKPQIYGGPRNEDPNDVLHVGMVASAVYARMRLRGAAGCVAPTPREWNRGTKKLAKNSPELWEHQRGKFIARHVTPAERALIPDKHDAVDAVGLALFAVGRLEPIRINARRRATH